MCGRLAVESDLKDSIHSIYLAGPVAMLDWRHLLVQGLRDDVWDWQNGAAFPVLERALFGRYDYVGPHWPFSKECPDWGRSVEPNYLSAFTGLSEKEYCTYCRDAIERADLVAAHFAGYLDRNRFQTDDWMTIAELNHAVSIGKKILSINRHPIPYESIFLEEFFVGDPSSRDLSPRLSLARQLGLSDREMNQDAGHGFVYFIEAVANRHIKIGWAKAPERRLKEFQTGSPTEYELLGTIPGSRTLERKLHKDFEEYHAQGEWFFGVKLIRDFIEANVVSTDATDE